MVRVDLELAARTPARLPALAHPSQQHAEHAVGRRQLRVSASASQLPLRGDVVVGLAAREREQQVRLGRVAVAQDPVEHALPARVLLVAHQRRAEHVEDAWFSGSCSSSGSRIAITCFHSPSRRRQSASSSGARVAGLRLQDRLELRRGLAGAARLESATREVVAHDVLAAGLSRSASRYSFTASS